MFFLLYQLSYRPTRRSSPRDTACEVLEELAGFEPAERQFSSLATKRNKPNSATIPDLLEVTRALASLEGFEPPAMRFGNALLAP